MKICLFHPWIKAYGGAELLILKYAQNSKHDVTIYTWIYLEDKTFEGFNDIEVKEVGPRFLAINPDTVILRGLFYSLMALFTKIDLSRYDTFVISTSGVAELVSLRNRIKNKTYAFVHTTLREARIEMSTNPKKLFKNLLYFLPRKVYLLLEKVGYRRIDNLIANSRLVAQRIGDAGIDKPVKVINPGVDVGSVNTKPSNQKYFLYPSRITPHKRQHLAIEAFKIFSLDNPGYQLKIVGGIRNQKYLQDLRNLAKGYDVIFETDVSEQQWSDNFHHAKAILFFPEDEDFGIAAIEAVAYGKYLIADKNGGFIDVVGTSSGALVDAKPRIIAKEMQFVVDNAELVRKIEQKNLSMADQLSWAKFAEKMDQYIGA